MSTSDAWMAPRAVALVGWRLDRAEFASTWASGEGAYLYGGRWSPVEERVVYAALDPATAVLEVAVHRGFKVLDTAPHVMTRFAFVGTPHLVWPSALPNPAWLTAAPPSAGQPEFGMALLRTHGAILVPSVVSPPSWNLVFMAALAGRLEAVEQRPFALDTRLHPPAR